MNMSGTALYEGCVVLFIAQVFGVDLSLGQQVTLLLLSVLSAVAVAGIRRRISFVKLPTPGPYSTTTRARAQSTDPRTSSIRNRELGMIET